MIQNLPTYIKHICDTQENNNLVYCLRKIYQIRKYLDEIRYSDKNLALPPPISSLNDAVQNSIFPQYSKKKQK